MGAEDEYRGRLQYQRNQKKFEENRAQSAGLSRTAQRVARERREAADAKLEEAQPKPFWRRFF
jgi:hypothetical protein